MADPDAADTVRARRRGARVTTAVTTEALTAPVPEPAAPTEPMPGSDSGATPEPAPSTLGVGLPASSTGVTSHSLGGPPVLVGSFFSEGTPMAVAGDYVLTEKPAYYQVYPRGCRQPSTLLAWPAGQRVRRDVYDMYGGDNAPATPAEARPVNAVGDGYIAPR